MQALARGRRTDENGLFNLDISALVSFDDTNEVETAEVPVNKIRTLMRCCYSNEIKSAKELKIYLKGDYPLYFPVVAFNTNPMVNPSALDMRTKKPVRNPALLNGQEHGILQPGMNLIETGFNTGYCEDLDRWLLTHQPIFEDSLVNRGVCRLYAIFVSETMNKFIINACTGFLAKIKDKKFIMSTLSVQQCNSTQPEYLLERPVLLCSFGNLDLIKPLNNVLHQMCQVG